jgi:hypothetical protein
MSYAMWVARHLGGKIVPRREPMIELSVEQAAELLAVLTHYSEQDPDGRARRFLEQNWGQPSGRPRTEQ